MQDGQDGITAAFALLDPAPATDTAPATDAAPATDTTPAPSSEEERLRGEVETTKAQHAALLDRTRRAELEGKVSDVGAALKLLDPEKHLNADGSINLDKLRGEFPGLYIQQMTATAPDGGGGAHFHPGSFGLESAVRSGETPLINYAFDQELKGGRK